MIDIISNKIFHLHNSKISYLFWIMPNNQLGHIYYGKNLGELNDDDVEYLIQQESKSAGTVKYSESIKNFTLADREPEYPVYGSSDFREGAIDISQNDEQWYADFKYKSYSINKTKIRDLDIPATYSNNDTDSETLDVISEDEEHLLRLHEFFTIFKDYGVIVRSQKLINLGKKDIDINNMMSGVLSLPTANYDFLSLSGAWLKERQIKRRHIEQGITSIESLKGASSHQQNPFAALVSDNATTNSGDIYASNLIYSGNFLNQVEVNEWNKTRLSIGINPKYFQWRLSENESFKTPEAILYYSGSGFNGLINETNGFTEDHIIDTKWKNDLRPVVFNNWEATYFDFNEEKLLSLARESKELGMECFVLDDGWYGHRDDDRSSLGNWVTDKAKFPYGLGHFSKQIHQMGMKFGLWFEPEMVSPDTELYKNHPDWVVHHPYNRVSIGRGQYVLDFTNPEVVKTIYQQMKSIISETKLDYIKWDMNRNITEAYSTYLKKIGRPQGEFFHRYIKGVYSLYSMILSSFPNILIEGCSGGGGRYDLGILYYSPQIWPSDDSDAVEKLSIMTGTTLAYPLSTFSNHLSAVPNDQVKRTESIKFRQDLASFGPLGFELDLNKLTDEDKECIKQQIEFYKDNRQLLLHGKFRQVLDLNPESNEVAFGVKNSESIFIGFFRKMTKPNSAVKRYLPISFIDENRRYVINNETSVSGSVLKYSGLLEPYEFDGANSETAQVSGDYQSWTYLLRSKKN
ncbi:alpha-galactosidase [Companilactobacillus sp. FL22-1]|uniref:alpha-galactosidase n=1 Tax=Companilactobacillus sp. FL22-1 TaxID=3373892 RepID=UPI0037540205